MGLVVLSKGFRRLGKETQALTLPHWIGARYGSPGMRTYFALLNLFLAISFVVLIIKGSALVMGAILGLSYEASVVFIVAFVFSYILLGGTYAHAYTNSLQGAMMIVVALAIVSTGAHYLVDGGLLEAVAAQDPNLAEPINPASLLYGSFWEVFVCGFVVSFGLVCQPHILMKSLYLRSDEDLNRYLVVAAVIGVIFASILLAGLFARAKYPGFVEAGVTPDAVMVAYINQVFSPVTGVLISVALLAAGMSTMDGILVGASTIAGSDLVLGSLGSRIAPNLDDEGKQALALKLSRVILVLMGVTSAAIAFDPPALVGLFAQAGIYGLVAASLAPVTFGIFVPETPRPWAFAAAVVGPLVHFAHYGSVVWVGGSFLNPAVSATEGVFASVAVLTVGTWRARRQRGAA